MLAQMIDKIVSLKETKTFEIGGQTYTDGHLTRIPPHVDRPEAISVSGLDGVCKLIRTELEKVGTTIMVPQVPGQINMDGTQQEAPKLLKRVTHA